MTTMLLPTPIFDEEHAAAVARLDDDLAAAVASGELHVLRRRAVTAYENALANAAGEPGDARWRVLAGIVAAFVARIPTGATSPHTAAAVARLKTLVAENLG
jgi:hypothetical protein